VINAIKTIMYRVFILTEFKSNPQFRDEESFLGNEVNRWNLALLT